MRLPSKRRTGTSKQQKAAPTILVNNAGITRDNLLMRMKAEEWDAIINTNLSSVFRMCKGAVRGMMKARRGRIITVASVVGVMGNAGQTNYAAAKAGIIGFSKSLAREIGSRGITVNVVAPGFIATDMTAQLSAEQQEQLAKQIPAWATGRRGGHRACGGLPGVAGGRLHHRRNAACQRRHVHDLSHACRQREMCQRSIAHL